MRYLMLIHQDENDMGDPAAMKEIYAGWAAFNEALAKAQGVPPYVIFHDTTLIEIARRKPRDLAEFAGITGVGQAKLERYGALFLDVVLQSES